MPSDRNIVQMLGKAGPAFFGSFTSLTDIQKHVIPEILDGHDVLVSSPTASGKTEAVLAPMVARLLRAEHKGVRLLAVAPTRALVNDLHQRVSGPLRALTWECGRQTGDHADKGREPDALITTPESFDSMLVRDTRWFEGSRSGHLLASVSGLFVDEAHVLEHSPRGDQVVWLISRLRRLRQTAADRGWAPDEQLQVCCASATLAEPERLATHLLGRTSRFVFVPGRREMDVCLSQDGLGFRDVQVLPGIGELVPLIPRVLSTDPEPAASLVWEALQCSGAGPSRKALIFVRSRQASDTFSAYLRDYLGARRDMYVAGHHASLAKDERERAEQEFARNRDAALVATTTLELGIDIGDVDLAVLLGPPPDTNSLLQRVGRAGRRTGRVRILPIAQNEMDVRAFASQLNAAREGTLDSGPTGRRWSVFIQQAASMVAQAGPKGRLREGLIEFAQSIWPEDASPTKAELILNAMVAEGSLIEDRGRLFLGDSLADSLHTPGGGFHNNFSGADWAIPVIDSTTREIIAHVSSSERRGTRVALSGRYWEVRHDGTELIVGASAGVGPASVFTYDTKRAYLRRPFAEHVRRGCGFKNCDAPLMTSNGATYWFHFGGSSYEYALKALIPNVLGIGGLVGVVVRGETGRDGLRSIANRPDRITGLIRSNADGLAGSLDPGRHHPKLPQSVRVEVSLDLFGIPAFVEWLETRHVFSVAVDDPRWTALAGILQSARVRTRRGAL